MAIIFSSIRYPEDLYEWIKYKAKRENRSINQTVIHILQEVSTQEGDETNGGTAIRNKKLRQDR